MVAGIFIGARDGLVIPLDPVERRVWEKKIMAHSASASEREISARVGINVDSFIAARQHPLTRVNLHTSDGPFTPSRASSAPAAGETDGDELTTDDEIANRLDEMAEEHDKAGRADDASLCRRIAAEHREKAESARRDAHKDDAVAAANGKNGHETFAPQTRISVTFPGGKRIV
jgi:hypothetical protein